MMVLGAAIIEQRMRQHRQMMLGTIGNRTPDLSLTFYSLILCAPVHFWAPTFKWGISLANVADFQSPIEKVSVPQQCGKGRCENSDLKSNR